MTDAHAHGHGHGTSLEDIVRTLKVGVNAGSSVSDAIDHAHVVMNNDNPDIGATIEHLRHDAKESLGSLGVDKEDPSMVPGYETLQRILNNYDNPVVNGHLRADPKNEASAAGKQQAASVYINRGQTFIASEKYDNSKAIVEAMARNLGEYNIMKKQIDNAKTSAELSQVAQPLLQRLYQQLEQYKRQHGNLDGYKIETSHGEHKHAA